MADVTVTDAAGNTMRLVEIGDGLRVCNFDRDADFEHKLVHDIKIFPCKNDDIFILAPIKSGKGLSTELINCSRIDQQFSNFFVKHGINGFTNYYVQ